jgi:hypothetical protein
MFIFYPSFYGRVTGCHIFIPRKGMRYVGKQDEIVEEFWTEHWVLILVLTILLTNCLTLDIVFHGNEPQSFILPWLTQEAIVRIKRNQGHNNTFKNQSLTQRRDVLHWFSCMALVFYEPWLHSGFHFLLTGWPWQITESS